MPSNRAAGTAASPIGPAYGIVRFERVEALDEADVVCLDRSLHCEMHQRKLAHRHTECAMVSVQAQLLRNTGT